MCRAVCVDDQVARVESDAYYMCACFDAGDRLRSVWSAISLEEPDDARGATRWQGGDRISDLAAMSKLVSLRGARLNGRTVHEARLNRLSTR